jgi:BTB/POZ domain
MIDPRSDETYDVKFLVGPEERLVQTNKFVLGYNSTVFHRMFFIDFPCEDAIVVPDCDADAFEMMVHSISGRDVIITADNAANIFYVAEKYDLLFLRRICKAFIVNSIDSTNALTLLNKYHHFNETDINEKCMAIILDDPQKFFWEPEFSRASVDVVRSILKPIGINCSSEIVVKALSSWMGGQGLLTRNSFNKEEWLKEVKDKLQITSEELEMKMMRQDLFHHFEYWNNHIDTITTSFTVTANTMFLHGFGLVVGKVPLEKFEFEIITESGWLDNQHVIVEKKGPKDQVSIQDIFIWKKPILHDKLTVKIKFNSKDFRPCIKYNNQGSVVSHLILSKIGKSF